MYKSTKSKSHGAKIMCLEGGSNLAIQKKNSPDIMYAKVVNFTISLVLLQRYYYY